MSTALWALLVVVVAAEVLLARAGWLARFAKLSPWFGGAMRGLIALAAAGAGSEAAAVVTLIAVLASARLATAYVMGVLQPRMRQSIVAVRVADDYFKAFRSSDYTSRRFAPIVPMLSGVSWLLDAGLGVAGAFTAEMSSVGALAAIGTVVAVVEAGVHGSAIALWRRRQEDALAAVAGDLNSQAPRVVLYTAALPETLSNVEQWIPALEASGEDAYVLTRELGTVAPLAQLTTLPIVYVKALGGLEALVPASVEVALYVDTSMRNNHLLRLTDLIQVQLHHGDSDKASSTSRLLRMYDHHFVAGDAAVARLQSAGVIRDSNDVSVIGRPLASALDRREVDRGAPTILYAPTWEGFHRDTDLSSLRMGVAIVSQLVADPTRRTVVRPHPFSGRIDKSLLPIVAEMRRLVGDGSAELAAPTAAAAVAALDEADVLITDVSGILGDFLYTGRPVIVVDSADLGEDELVATYPTVAAAYVVRSDLSDLDDKLTLALGADPRSAERGAMARHVLGDLTGSGIDFAKALAALRR